jgi:hypothetical protein
MNQENLNGASMDPRTNQTNMMNSLPMDLLSKIDKKYSSTAGIHIFLAGANLGSRVSPDVCCKLAEQNLRVSKLTDDLSKTPNVKRDIETGTLLINRLSTVTKENISIDKIATKEAKMYNEQRDSMMAELKNFSHSTQKRVEDHLDKMDVIDKSNPNYQEALSNIHQIINNRAIELMQIAGKIGTLKKDGPIIHRGIVERCKDMAGKIQTAIAKPTPEQIQAQKDAAAAMKNLEGQEGPE